jgi:hypothetical protein
MEQRINWLTPELYKLGLQQARLLYPESPKDMLHTVILNLLERVQKGKLEECNINKNLLFISIRNAMYNLKIQENSRAKYTDSILEHQDFLLNNEYDSTNDSRMESVSRVYDELSKEDQSFFLQRFVSRATKKKLCSEFKLSSEEFNQKEEHLKTLIKNYYAQTKESNK